MQTRNAQEPGMAWASVDIEECQDPRMARAIHAWPGSTVGSEQYGRNLNIERIREETAVFEYNLSVALKNTDTNLIVPEMWPLCMAGNLARADRPSMDLRLAPNSLCSNHLTSMQRGRAMV